MTTKKQNKLRSYFAVTVGAGCAASVAEGAVTFYGKDSANDTNANPSDIAFYSFDGSYVGNPSGGSTFFARDSSFDFFTDGTVDLVPNSSSTYPGYFRGSFWMGATMGDQNYANISFNGNDGTYEAVAQFSFDGAGGGYLIAVATTNAVPNPQDLSAVGGPALSITSGKAMIDAVPEPSGLALLALGSAGLAARRQRRKAA